FAGAVGADERHDLSRADIECDVRQRPLTAIALRNPAQGAAGHDGSFTTASSRRITVTPAAKTATVASSMSASTGASTDPPLLNSSRGQTIAARAAARLTAKSALDVP